MAEKLTFTLQVFSLGFSVVMVVLFTLYGLIAVFNRLSGRLMENDERADTLPSETGALPPQLAAAAAAAVNYHLKTTSGRAAPSRIKIHLSPGDSAGWTTAGRRALLENNLQLELLRRKKQLEKVQSNR